MRILTLATTLLATAPAVLAQNSFVLPTRINGTLNDSRPFGFQRNRYMQWYSPAEWRATVAEPHRIWGLALKAGTGGELGRNVVIEITMANSVTRNPSSLFENNIVSGRVVVFPRGTYAMPRATGWPLSIQFTQEFVWDGVSGVVVDIKMFDNGNNNQIYSYSMERASSLPSAIVRMYKINDPNAQVADILQTGQGIPTRFLFREAMTYPYGTGCPGHGGIVPVAATSGGWPIPANTTWTHEIRNAPSQRNAYFVIGASNTLWAGSLPLPHELVEIGANGCFLRADPLAWVVLPTVGGGAGGGFASFNLPMPPITVILGSTWYSQWLVLDPNAANGVLAVTQGLAHRVGSD